MSSKRDVSSSALSPPIVPPRGSKGKSKSKTQPSTPSASSDIVSPRLTKNLLASGSLGPTNSSGPTPAQLSKLEAMTVAVRLRPLLSREIEDEENGKPVVRANGNVLSVKEESNFYDFTFPTVYAEAKQEEIFQSASPLIPLVLSGINCTIMAYGQTASGKTFTMTGGENENQGLIPRVIEQLFTSIKEERESSPMHTDISFLFQLSYLEIYNEKAFDLLGADLLPLPIRETKNSSFVLPGLSKHIVEDKQSCLNFIEQGNEMRTTKSTKQNEESSRSHSVLILYIEKTVSSRTSNLNSYITKSKLNLVDLAGSEKYNDESSGEDKKETVNINKSLSSLNNVITKLSQPNPGHIPYRDSILTRLLKDSLGGNAKTLLIACLTPTLRDVRESLRTLRYASTAMGIKSNLKVNRTALVDYLKDILNETQLRKIFDQEKNEFLGIVKTQLTEMRLTVSKVLLEKEELQKEKVQLNVEWEIKYKELFEAKERSEIWWNNKFNEIKQQNDILEKEKMELSVKVKMFEEDKKRLSAQKEVKKKVLSNSKPGSNNNSNQKNNHRSSAKSRLTVTGRNSKKPASGSKGGPASSVKPSSGGKAKPNLLHLLPKSRTAGRVSEKLRQSKTLPRDDGGLGSLGIPLMPNGVKKSVFDAKSNKPDGKKGGVKSTDMFIGLRDDSFVGRTSNQSLQPQRTGMRPRSLSFK